MECDGRYNTMMINGDPPSQLTVPRHVKRESKNATDRRRDCESWQRGFPGDGPRITFNNDGKPPGMFRARAAALNASARPSRTAIKYVWNDMIFV